MLINFTFENFRSFRDNNTLSMEATANSEHKESLIVVGKYELLPIAVMYGANSSGKSNVILAFNFFRTMILDSIKNERNSKLAFEPFLLDDESSEKSTKFEIQFVADKKTYRYGFESDENVIRGEWLFEKTVKKEICLFDAENGEVEVNEKHFSEAKGFDNLFLGNKLFLPLVEQQSKSANKSKKIINWFRNNLNVISGIKPQGYEGFTLQMLKDKLGGYSKAVDFFKKLDLGFVDYKVEEYSFADIKKMFAKENPNDGSLNGLLPIMSDDDTFVITKTKHTVKSKSGKQEERFFEEDSMESEGTKKIISLSGPIFDTLQNGKTIVIDELDAKLHPFLTREIVKLFTNKESNPNGAQLIFATHDTNLLDLSFLRRDEIWFTEKDKNEASDLYSLAEFKQIDGSKIRKDASLEKNYINGRYGAIPYINNNLN